jgi:hypothetical protein
MYKAQGQICPASQVVVYFSNSHACIYVILLH